MLARGAQPVAQAALMQLNVGRGNFLINLKLTFFSMIIFFSAFHSHAQTQSRTVVCRDQNGNVVADSFCTSPKPAESQACVAGGGGGGGGPMCNTCTAYCSASGYNNVWSAPSPPDTQANCIAAANALCGSIPDVATGNGQVATTIECDGSRIGGGGVWTFITTGTYLNPGAVRFS